MRRYINIVAIILPCLFFCAVAPNTRASAAKPAKRDKSSDTRGILEARHDEGDIVIDIAVDRGGGSRYFWFKLDVENNSRDTVVFDPEQMVIAITDRSGLTRIVPTVDRARVGDLARSVGQFDAFGGELGRTVFNRTSRMTGNYSTEALIRMDMEEASARSSGRYDYLEKVSIAPGANLSGYLLAPRDDVKQQRLSVGVVLNATPYWFSWDL